MNTFITAVLDRLGPIEASEMEFVVRGINDLQLKGWTKEEAASKLQWMEHVNPHVGEDVALRNMRLVDERVAARMATK